MISFVGAGPGAVDLITVRGQRLLEEAEVIVYAGSLVNPALLDYAGPACTVHDSASMTLEEVMAVLIRGHREGKQVVRLHTGDPSLYGAVKEQYAWLRREGIPFQTVPGVSSFLAAAASLEAEYTAPGVSQTVILTRTEGRTPVPDGQQLAALAGHGASLVLFLSAGLMEQATAQLVAGGVAADCPAAIVYKASWEDEKVIRTTVEALAGAAAEAGIGKTALVLVGEFLGEGFERSKLYDPGFTHGFRAGREP